MSTAAQRPAKGEVSDDAGFSSLSLSPDFCFLIFFSLSLS